MKKIPLILIILLNAFLSFAQNQDTLLSPAPSKKDSINIIKKTISKAMHSDKQLKSVKTRWLMLDLGLCSFLYQNETNQTVDFTPYQLHQAKSLNWNLHIFQTRINLYQHKFNLKYGLFIAFNKYHFANSSLLSTNNQLPTIDPQAFSQNRLYTSRANIPLLLNFESNPKKKKKSFHLNLGIYSGVLLASNQKYVSQNNKTKIYDDFSLQKFNSGIYLSSGFGPVNFYCQYGLEDLFRAETMQGINPINIGVSIIPF